MVDKNKDNADLLNKLPSKTHTKKANFKIIDDSLKKSATYALDNKIFISSNAKKNNDNNFKDPLSLVKKLKTVQNVKISESAVLKLMSENIYSLPSNKKKDDDNNSDISDDEDKSNINDTEINLKHRRIKVKTKTLKKISAVIPKRLTNNEYYLNNNNNTGNLNNNYNTANSTFNVKKNSDHEMSYSNNNLISPNKKDLSFKNSPNNINNVKNNNELIDEKEEDEDDNNLFNFDKNEDNINNALSKKFNDELNINSTDKESKKEEDDIVPQSYSNDEILNNLINEYYLDIVDNFNGNFEDYVVNNLTIISYLNKAISNIDRFTDELSYKKEINVNPYKKLSEENKALLTKQFDKNKKILFLDLDETLIHSDLNNQFNNWDAQIIVPVDEESSAELNILIRPYLKEFLEFASKNFNVVLFTAGIESYANSIIGYLDPMEEYFHLRLYRESCFQFNNFFIKDLGILEGFDLKDMIIIDNCVYSFALNLNNGILIPSYYNDPEDRELLGAIDYLKDKLMEVDDIRKVNEEYYGLETIRNFLYDKLVSEGVITN